MTALLRAEARRLAATRSTIVMACIAASYGTLAVVMATLLAQTQRPELDRGTILQIVRGVTDLAAPVAVILGIVATAGEFRHGTIVPTLLVAPRRARLIAAKVLSQTLLGGAIGAVGSILSLAAGLAFISAHDVDLDRPLADLALTVLAVTLVVAIYGALGASLGTLVRNQTAAVTIALVWLLAVEEIVPSVLRACQHYDGGCSTEPPGGFFTSWSRTPQCQISGWWRSSSSRRSRRSRSPRSCERSEAISRSRCAVTLLGNRRPPPAPHLDDVAGPPRDRHQGASSRDALSAVHAER